MRMDRLSTILEGGSQYWRHQLALHLAMASLRDASVDHCPVCPF
jgi:hypothetical protein